MPTAKVYLTIDDGPSERFEELIDFLFERNIPALFFNRGDQMEAFPDAAVYGIQKGFVMANHGYNHQRATKLSLEEIKDEILKTEAVLERLYQKANVQRSRKYFRFPYMDRGMGSCLIEPGPDLEEHKDFFIDMAERGLGNDFALPTPVCIQKKRLLQDFLKAQGFERFPNEAITLPSYKNTEMAEAVDVLATFSTSDWAVRDKYRGQKGFDGLDDLKRKIDNDPYLWQEDSEHVLLAHAKPEDFETVTALLDYLDQKGVTFLDFD